MIKTDFGFSIEQLRKKINNRKVLIWGYGDIGREVLYLCRDLQIEGFIYTNSIKKSIYGYNIFDISKLDKNKYFVIIATYSFLHKAKEVLYSFKYSDEDFISYLKLKRNEAVIDIIGEDNNLSFEQFKKVYTKLKKDKFFKINFGEWYDPLKNKDILKMLDYIDDSLVTIRTPLDCDSEIVNKLSHKNVYKIEVYIYGNRQTHQLRYGNSSWEKLKKNLSILPTIKANIIIKYLQTKYNDDDLIKTIKDLNLKMQ